MDDNHDIFYNKKKRTRVFKLFDLETLDARGRFCGKTPMQAARKAFRRFIIDMKKTTHADQVDNVTFEFGLYEPALKKVVQYSGKWIPLTEHIRVKLYGVGKCITYKYKSCVKRRGKI